MTHVYTEIDSSLGRIVLLSEENVLTGLYFAEQSKTHIPRAHVPDAVFVENTEVEIFTQANKQLAEYFAGTRTTFKLRYTFTYGTHFQQKVWQSIAKMPHGITVSYRDIATQIGNSRASRAVAATTGQNPLLLIVPCHRIIGSDSSLTGYAGGLKRKQALLTLEKNL
ncbi:MAG: methylated-DNA--[protein]-cysteine S-methyltransferase [bacterium]